jgi:hypothetical protein
MLVEGLHSRHSEDEVVSTVCFYAAIQLMFRPDKKGMLVRGCMSMSFACEGTNDGHQNMHIHYTSRRV